jgi:hypothetical protein
MADLMPSPPLLSLIPHDISQDPPFNGNNNHPLPIVPEASIGGGCNDDHLKVCIVAASESLWGVGDMFPAQLGEQALYLQANPLSPDTR